MGGTPIVPPQLSGFTLGDIQAGFALFVSRFNTRFPTHTITAPTVATASQGDVQTALDTLTGSVNTALSGSLSVPLTSPVLGAFDKYLLQSCCNGLARSVDQVIAPIVAVLEGLNGTGEESSAVKDALLNHQTALVNFNTLFASIPAPAVIDAERESMLSTVQAML